MLPKDQGQAILNLYEQQCGATKKFSEEHWQIKIYTL